MMRRPVAAMALAVLLWTALMAPAQIPAPPPAPQAAVMSSADLDQLVGPVALYPDPLLSELLPAATLPAQIVMADRFISQGNDPSLIEQQPWDPCIKAIAHYPELLKWMDDNLPWTTELGQAFMNQPQDVMDAVQRLRGKAQVLGNLPDTPQETVVNDDGEIDIEPTEPDQMYLPVYQPDLIYFQPGIYCSYGVGWVIGPWLIHDWDWRHHRIISWGPGHPRPAGWWHLAPRQRIGAIARGGAPIWRPQGRGSMVLSSPADRGFAARPQAPETGRAVARPATPPPSTRARESRPSVEARPPVETRPSVEARPRVEARSPVESRPAPEPRGSSGVGMFGGPQNSSEARQSSARGMESRGVAPSAPARSFSAPAPAPSGGGGARRR